VPRRTRIAFMTLLACAVAATPAGAGGHKQEFKVGSTLAGKKVLPHRIHWLGFPRIAESNVKRVDFLIDGKLRWIEHNPPYTYGFDGNYLVTSWLAPGRHKFTVRVTAKGGQVGRSSTTARVLAARPPPAQLAGTWKRNVKGGTWRLVVDKIGWRFRGPGGAGDLVDVGYLSAGGLEARGGIHMTNRNPQEGNNWCNEPFEPVRYRWSVDGGSLSLTLAGPKRCDGQSDVWAGRWTRAP
jgi:hypothetical protein